MANNVSAIIREKYEARAQKELFKTPVFLTTMNTMQFLPSTEEYKRSGDTVNIVNVASDSLTVRSRGTLGSTISLDDITPANIQLTINQHSYVGFRVDNISSKQSDVDLSALYGEKAGMEMAQAIDAAIYAALVATTTVGGSAGVGLTKDLILQANQKLDENDVPSTDRIMVVSALGKRELLNIDGFVSAEKLGSDVMVRKGGENNVRNYLGEFYGIDFYFSNQITGSASPTATNNVLYHKDALAGVVQMQEFRGTYDPMTLSTVYTQEFVYGLKLLDNEKAVKVIS